MQTKLSHTEYDCFDTIGVENIECPIDIEYSLPDYCPDIQKVLKCIPNVELSSYSFTLDKLMCEGKLVLHVQYLDEKCQSIRVCDIVKEFSLAREIKRSEEKMTGRITASVGHIICRATSARKIDIHIPVILNMTLYAHKKNYINCDSDELEKKTEKVKISNSVMNMNHSFTIEKELELSQSAMPIESILRKNINVSSIKCDVSSGKINIDGVSDLNIVYHSFSENSQVEKMNYSLPFSQSIEADGISNDCISYCDIDVLEFSVQPKEDSSGENTIVRVFIKLNACVFVYEQKEINAIVDAYSVRGESEIEFENVNFNYLSERHNERLSYTKNVFLADDEIEKLLDCWCEDISINAYAEKDKINYRGKFAISLTYIGKSKRIFSVTKNFDFTMTREFEESYQRKCDVSVNMSIRDYRIVDGNNIEFNCDAVLYSHEFETYTKKVVSSVNLSEENTQDDSYIKVYYSKKGEEMWEIGKKYSCPIAKIVENNKLSDSLAAPGGPLLIY